MSKRGKDKRSTDEETTHRPPNVWGWIWNKIPAQLRPIALYLVLFCLTLSFVLGIAKEAKNVFGNRPDPTPTLSLTWTRPKVVHIVREHKSFDHCAHDAYILPTESVAEVSTASSDNHSEKLQRHGYPIAPAALWLTVLQERRSEFDQLVVTSLELHIEENRPLPESTALVLEFGTCASQYLPPNKLGYLQIDPTRRTYDVLHPRMTSPLVAGVEVVSSGGVGASRVEVNALKPGIYKLSLSGEYALNGRQFKFGPLTYSMAVPDYGKVQSLYYSDFGEWLGPEDPDALINELLTTTRRAYLKTELIKNGQTAGGLQGSYFYVVNMGKDVDLTGWILARKSGGEYRFPTFVLKAGSGVRIWERQGSNTNRDLFGASELFAETTDPTDAIQFLDRDGNLVSHIPISLK